MENLCTAREGGQAYMDHSDYFSLVVRPLLFFFRSLHHASTTLAWSISMASFPSPSHKHLP